MRTSTRLAALVLVGGLVAACSSPAASPSVTAGASSPAAATASAAASEDAATPAAPSPSAAACAAENLETKTPGTLTIGTDNPAFPPYFDPPAEGEEATEPWELGDPTNGRGFESAVAYAIADELGYTADQVEWVYVPFNNAFAPGEKEFDFDINQVSFTEERAEAVDLSEGYYFLNQALVATKDTPIAGATTLADLKEYRLGAQVGTTSLAYIEEEIQPTAEVSVYDTNDAAISALNAGQIDGIVVDLPTAFFVTAVQMEDTGVIVGQFPPAEGEQEHFSLVLEKDSPLTECVNGAIASLDESGELESITIEWLSEAAGAPEFTP
jgi:polar amino acid transport system substrate-binding protein